MDDTELDLEGLTTEPEADEPPLHPAFRILNEDDAAWVVGLINEAEAIIKLRKAAAKAHIEDAIREHKRLLNRFEGELEAWSKENLPKNKRTISLLTGTAGFRSQGPRWTVDTKAASVEEVKAVAPEAIKTREEVSVSGLQEWLRNNVEWKVFDAGGFATTRYYIKATGEEIALPPGVAWEDEKDVFKIGAPKA